MNKNCYLFYGNNHYSIKEKTNAVLLEHGVSEDAVEVYDYEEDGLHLPLSNALTLPFLVDKKGVVIRNASFLTRNEKASPEELNDLIRFCEMMIKETILIIQAPYDQLDGQKKIVKFLKKHIIHQSLNPKKNFNVYDYVKQKILDHQMKIEPFALTQFVQRIQHDFDSINNEVEKLLSYANGKDVINVDMISQITSKDVDDNIFHLVNAVVDKDKGKIMEIYEDLKSISTNEIWMLTIIANKFIEMLHTKALIMMGYSQKDISAYFNVSSGRAYYMKKNAEGIDDDVLINHIQRLADLDYHIKSGQIDKALGIELFLLKV